MKNIIYMDHAATTQPAPEAVEAMLPYMRKNFGNPSSGYEIGIQAKVAVEQARSKIAEVIGAKPEQIYFTAGGTESDNWVLEAAAERYGKSGRHIITTQIEHHAVLHTCQWLEKQGYEVTYLPVSEQGIVSVEKLRRALRPDTIFVSVMFANNEIGTLQPIQEIGVLLKDRKILFHTDAVQAFGHVPIDVEKMHIDFLSASGHKCYGPKGIGFLYMKDRTGIGPFIHGGAQEKKMRAGTENVPGIVGFGAAASLCLRSLQKRAEKEQALRDYLIDRVLKEVPYVRLNGSRTMRLPNNANFSFQFIEGENLRVLLDMDGICSSGGSACTTGQTEPSHVLKALGLPDCLCNGSLRLTIGAETTKREIDYTVEAIKRHVKELRAHGF